MRRRSAFAGVVMSAMLLGGVAAAECGDAEIPVDEHGKPKPGYVLRDDGTIVPVSYEDGHSHVSATSTMVQADPVPTATPTPTAAPIEVRYDENGDVESYPALQGSILGGKTRIRP